MQFTDFFPDLVGSLSGHRGVVVTFSNPSRGPMKIQFSFFFLSNQINESKWEKRAFDVLEDILVFSSTRRLLRYADR